MEMERKDTEMDQVPLVPIEKIQFDNSILKELPLDKKGNFIRQVSGAIYAEVKPTPLAKPVLVAHSDLLLKELGIDPKEVGRPDFVEYMAGNKLLPGSQPAAHCYCGHQFGYFAGQLGDGAAIYLGELLTPSGQRWELQFKGSGLTPFSRQADGRKVLRSSLREFLCSEAMYGLGIPTTRAATIVMSRETTVVRDPLYEGSPIKEPCSVILRAAETFLRFGSFEIFKPADPQTGAEGPSVGNTELRKQLITYTLKHCYPDIWQSDNGFEVKVYEFFVEVCRRTAKLVALWQSVGFCHGVLNTDNMSITGLTIDYGPFGFMDRYNPEHVCNASDEQGRYSYKNQPKMCRWNCQKLGEALAPEMKTKDLEEGLGAFDSTFEREYWRLMRSKLGFLDGGAAEAVGVRELLEELLETMETTGADFTNTFRHLSDVQVPKTDDEASRETQDDDAVLLYILSQLATPEEMAEAMKPQLSERQLRMALMMAQVNPQLAQQLDFIQSQAAKYEEYRKLKELSPEKKTSDDMALWKAWLKQYRKALFVALKREGERQGKEAEAVYIEFTRKRKGLMNSTNPRIVLRNHIAQKAIAAANKGDFAFAQGVLEALYHPYRDQPETRPGEPQDVEERVVYVDATRSGEPPVLSHPLPGPATAVVKELGEKPPGWACKLRVSCSS